MSKDNEEIGMSADIARKIADGHKDRAFETLVKCYWTRVIRPAADLGRRTACSNGVPKDWERLKERLESLGYKITVGPTFPDEVVVMQIDW